VYQQLISLLSDTVPGNQEGAVTELGRLKDPRAITALVQILDDKKSAMMLRALKSLGEIGDHKAALPVARFLADTDRLIRVEAAKVLGDLHVQETVPYLQQALDDWYHKVVRAAWVALGGMKVDTKPKWPLFEREAILFSDTGVLQVNNKSKAVVLLGIRIGARIVGSLPYYDHGNDFQLKAGDMRNFSVRGEADLFFRFSDEPRAVFRGAKINKHTCWRTCSSRNWYAR
jgi:hypothetical protein